MTSEIQGLLPLGNGLSRVRLSLSIMAVPERVQHVRSMMVRLDGQLIQARRQGLDVVGTSVFYDTEHRGPWFCWRGAWELHRQYGSTHHVVLQDDIVFCADLPAALFCMIEARPDDMISGFLPRKSVRKAVGDGLHWVRTRRFLWAPCVLLPTSMGDEALRWIDVQEGTAVAADWSYHDDVRLGAFLKSHKIATFVPVPHPVEHVGDQLGIGSILGHLFNPLKRRACGFGAWRGEDAVLGSEDWSDLRFVKE